MNSALWSLQLFVNWRGLPVARTASGFTAARTSCRPFKACFSTRQPLASNARNTFPAQKEGPSDRGNWLAWLAGAGCLSPQRWPKRHLLGMQRPACGAIEWGRLAPWP